MATNVKVILYMQTMRLPRFHYHIDIVVEPNITAISKTQNIDFERHCLSGQEFLTATESVFWSDWRRDSRCQRLRVSLVGVFVVLS